MIATVVTSVLLAASCHVGGHGAFVVPDNLCTPGAYQRLTRAQVCTSKDRPALPVAERRRLLASYGVPKWTGANGELDHRVPLFLGGLTVRSNLWPEVGSIPNQKDRLEVYVRRRICTRLPHPMSVRTGIRIFLSNWVHAYHAYFG